MKRLLSSLILLVSLLVPMHLASAQSGTTLGDPLVLPPDSTIHPQFTGCSRVDVAAVNAAFEQRVVELVNQRRAENALPPLKRTDNLDYAARFHADDMATDNYFDHGSYDRDGSGALVMVCSTGTRLTQWVPDYSWRGENIAAGYTTPESVMEGWMNSDGHRANILRPQFTEIGVGYYPGNAGSYYHHYWVQDFDARFNVYPVVINNEAAVTASQQVSLYIYGEGTWNEMRLRNDDGAWTGWQPFQKNLTWDLPCSSGTHTVSVEMRKTGQTAAGASASDSILLQNGAGGAAGVGNLPASITFLYGQSTHQFNAPSYTFQPTNSASSQALNWTLTQSGFESAWLNLSAASGATPDGFFTITPAKNDGILDTPGDHTGMLTINATSTDAQCPASATASIPVHLLVTPSLQVNFLPVIIR